MNPLRTAATLAASLMLLLPGAHGGAPEPAGPAAEPIRADLLQGRPAPLFSAARLDGGTLSLAALRGHVVLLDFWAVNCPPCRIEMPALETIHRRYARRGLQVIGVTEMDPARDEALQFATEAGVTYPIVLDPGARIGALYGLEAHPTTFVIDARGHVRHVNAGYLRGEEKEIERAVREALDASTRTP